MSTGKIIRLHQDGVQSVVLLYRPEVTSELELSAHWLRENVTLTMTEGEMLDLAERLTKAVKKVRKHKRKQAKRDRFVSLEEVEHRIHNGKKR